MAIIDFLHSMGVYDVVIPQLLLFAALELLLTITQTRVFKRKGFGFVVLFAMIALPIAWYGTILPMGIATLLKIVLGVSTNVFVVLFLILFLWLSYFLLKRPSSQSP